MKRIIFVFFGVLMFFSCTTYKITDNDIEWQPYQEGDILIFESNKGEIDTINIKSIEVHTNPTDPLDIFPTMAQTLFVTTEKRACLEMNTWKKGTNIHFTIRLGNDKLRYPCSILSIKELSEMNPDKNNRYIIEAKEHCDNMKDYPFDLRYIYWSKEYGYLGLEFKENYLWKLKSFIRGGKNIWLF